MSQVNYIVTSAKLTLKQHVEKLGFVGRQEGMVAQAVVLLRKKGV